MKPFYLILTLIPALLIGRTVSAQISVDEVDAGEESVTFQDKLKSIPVDVDYFSRARYKAERAAIRKERNYLEFNSGVQGALTSYNDPWISVSGGDNSIALTAVIGLRHVFTKNLFTIETKFSAKLGYNRMKVETQRLDADGNPMVDDSGNKIMDSEGVWFKNQDEFVVSVAPSFKMSENWSYGSILNFRSQFVNGYKSRTEQKKEHLKSKFMTPGYLDISLGITYKSPKPKFPIVINLSPIALNATFAENDWIRRRQVEERVDSEGKKTETEISRHTTTVSKIPTRRRNTKAVPRSRSTSTARSAKRDSCATARRSTPSTAGSPTSARRTRSATTLSSAMPTKNGTRQPIKTSRTSPGCRSIRSHAGKIRSISRQQNTSPRR